MHNTFLKYANHELHAAIQKVLESGERSRYIAPEGFLWEEFSSTLARCLHRYNPKAKIPRHMPASVKLLAQKLVVVSSWDLPLRDPTPRNSITPENHLRRTPAPLEFQKNPFRRTPAPLEPQKNSSIVFHRLTDTLRDALGDLYGSGKRARFVTSSGKFDWRLLGESCGLSPKDAKEVATTSCRQLVREIEDYVLSHLSPVERFKKESHLGLRPWEVEVE